MNKKVDLYEFSFKHLMNKGEADNSDLQLQKEYLASVLSVT